MRDIARFIRDVRGENNVAYQIALDLRDNLTEYDDQEIADKVRMIRTVIETVTHIRPSTNPLPPAYQSQTHLPDTHPIPSSTYQLIEQPNGQEMLYEIIRRTDPRTTTHDELDELMHRVLVFVRDTVGTDNDAYVLAQDIMENYYEYTVDEIDEKLRWLTSLVQSIEISTD